MKHNRGKQPISNQCKIYPLIAAAQAALLITVAPQLNAAEHSHHDKHSMENIAYSMLLDLPEQVPPPQLRQSNIARPVNPTAPNQLTDRPNPTHSMQCEVDFNDQGALSLSEPGLWFDRVYIPWYQSCDNQRFVDIRVQKYDHFHLGFEDSHIEPCFTHEQAFPSHIDEDDNCTYVDVPTEPRTRVTPHYFDETFKVRMYNFNGDERAKFDLARIRVLSSSVELCYNHSLAPHTEWEAAEPPAPGEQPGWYCWDSLGPGYWDLSAWVQNVAEVRITGATDSNFSLDDLMLKW